MKVKLAFNIVKPNELMAWSSGNLGYEVTYTEIVEAEIPDYILREFESGNLCRIDIVANNPFGKDD